MIKHTIRKCLKHGDSKHYINHNKQYYCADCRNEYVCKYRNKIKNKLVLIAGGCCELCGYNRCIQALEFHHFNPKDKNFGISQMNGVKNFITLLEEIKKCCLLCSNCHQEVESGYSSIKEENRNDYLILIELEIQKYKESKELKKIDCPICGNEFIVRWGKKCCSKECSNESKRKVTRPSNEQLLEGLKNSSYRALGKKYGVSGRTIKNWLK